MSESIVENPFRINVEYKYTFEKKVSVHFSVVADLASKEQGIYSLNRPEWALLDFNKCPNCPLNPAEHPYCPAALSIVDIIEYFSTSTSFSKCRCDVKMAEKTVYVEKPLQDALYPLIGLRLATSRCPFFAGFRPMARFHEPFSTPFYTVCRATAFYLMGRYFKQKSGGAGSAEEDFSGLKELYKNINGVNSRMAARLNQAGVMDATPNSIVILSVFGTSVTYFFDDYIKILEQLY